MLRSLFLPHVGIASNSHNGNDRRPGSPAITADGHTLSVDCQGQVAVSRFWKMVAARSHAGEPHGLLTAWWLWEQLAQRAWPAAAVPGSPYGVLKLRPTVYRGIPIELPDGTEIKPGALVGELHVNNLVVLSLGCRGFGVFAFGRAELEAIARWASRAEDRIEALYGITMIGAAASRLGFYRRPRPLTSRVRADRLFMNGLLALYNREGVARLRQGRILNAPPVEIWMSRNELIRRYGECVAQANGRATRLRA